MDFGPENIGPYDPYMDFRPEDIGPYDPYMTFSLENLGYEVLFSCIISELLIIKIDFFRN